MVLAGYSLIKAHAWVRKALKSKYPVLVVDEYQDLGIPLHQIVTHLCFDGGMRLFAVGDPDQSIYGFTGARPALLNEIADREDVEAVRLRLNYRCGKTIIVASTIALAEKRDFESAEDHQGVVQDYECQQGFDEQVALGALAAGEVQLETATGFRDRGAELVGPGDRVIRQGRQEKVTQGRPVHLGTRRDCACRWLLVDECAAGRVDDAQFLTVGTRDRPERLGQPRDGGRGCHLGCAPTGSDPARTRWHRRRAGAAPAPASAHRARHRSRRSASSLLTVRCSGWIHRTVAET